VVNPFDVLIAGTAISHGASRIITDDRDFLVIGKVTEVEMTVFE
jgi:predicted nucleic acid-binding protein